MPDFTPPIEALVFDVFGTVVDWRTPIIDELTATTSEAGIPIDPSTIAELADEWRLGYGLGTRDVESGALPWQTVDQLHRGILDRLLPTYGLQALTEDQRTHLNLAWHRLTPWPDSVEGLTKLKQHHTIATLSNGNVQLLTNMAQHAGLPWDHILSAELFGHFKPAPEVYLGAAHHLNLQPDQLMMVATHAGDLRAAARQGLRTAYIPRPLEHGPDRPQLGKSTEDHFDLEVTTLIELAEVLTPQP